MKSAEVLPITTYLLYGMKSPKCALYNMAGRVVHARILVILFIAAIIEREEWLRRRKLYQLTTEVPRLVTINVPTK